MIMIFGDRKDEVAMVTILRRPIPERPAFKRAFCSTIGYIVSAALMLGLSNEAVASPPLLFGTAGNGTLTGENGQCFLTRKYSDGTSPLNLRIDQFPLEYAFETTISFEHIGGGHGMALPKTSLDGMAVSAKEHNQRPIEEIKENDGVHQSYWFLMKQNDVDQMAKSGYLFAIPWRDVGLQLPVPHVAEAIIELRRCEQLLIETSGLPQEAIRRIKSFPLPIGTINNQQFYSPSREKNDDQEDQAVARGMIDNKGVVMGCEVIHRAKSETLNTQACRRIMNLIFKPAIDTAGNSVSAPYFIAQGWRIP